MLYENTFCTCSWCSYHYL